MKKSEAIGVNPLFPVTESGTFDPIYQGRVRPSNLLDISSRYTYDTFSDLQ